MEIKLQNVNDFVLLLNKKNIEINNLSWIEPFGIAMLKSFINLNKVTYKFNACKSKVESYLSIILQANDINESSSYMFQEIKESNNEDVSNFIVNKLLEAIPKNSDKADIKKYLNYMISEMLDNVISHSNSDGYNYIVAQYYPTLKKIQIAIVDTGIGFMNSLKTMHNPKDEKEAILKALEKEITGSNKFDTYGVQKHAGLGLYFLKRIVNKTNGNLVVISNDTIYSSFANKGENVEVIEYSEWKGSAVVFEFFIDNLDYEWEQIRKLIQFEVYPDEEEEVEFQF